MCWHREVASTKSTQVIVRNKVGLKHEITVSVPLYRIDDALVRFNRSEIMDCYTFARANRENESEIRFS